MSLEKELEGIKKNISLKDYTTFKIGGSAQYFFIAQRKEDLVKAVALAKEKEIPYFILGGGSNLLVSDQGYQGLAIKNEITEIEFFSSKIICGGGVRLSSLMNLATEKELTGLEWAVAIPGTVAGAIYGNAGAFGQSIQDIIKEVEVFDSQDLTIKTFKKEECSFSYRESIFKKEKNLIILSVTLELKKGEGEKIKSKIKEHLEYKKKNHSWDYPSAGSVFKNPTGFFAAELIDKCGLKGKRINQAMVSEKHANFILNLGGAKEKDVKKLIELIKKEVKNKFKIDLVEEIQYLK